MYISEKETFTKNRKNLPANRIHNISVNEIEQWGQYCLVPLAIPCVDFTGIADWFFDNHLEITEASRKLLRHNRIDINLSNTVASKPWEKQREQAFLNEFPKFVEQLYDVFPFKKISTFRFWQSFAPIEMHRENDDFRDFPNNFRTMVYDENPEPTFWLHPKPDASLGWGYERLTVDPTKESFLIDAYRETESNTFVFNNSEYCHAARKVPGYNKILMFLLVEWDWVGYEKLMDKSL